MPCPQVALKLKILMALPWSKKLCQSCPEVKYLWLSHGWKYLCPSCPVKNTFGSPMAKNIYGPPMAKSIYGPLMAKNTSKGFKTKMDKSFENAGNKTTNIKPRTCLWKSSFWVQKTSLFSNNIFLFHGYLELVLIIFLYVIRNFKWLESRQLSHNLRLQLT